MSFQTEAQMKKDMEENNGMQIIYKSDSAFENFIMQCLKAPEWELRKFLKKVLIRAGFEIFEDGYVSERAAKDARYSKIHNMIAIRGNPKFCFAAHTDVCRDHSELSKMGDHSSAFWQQYGRFQELDDEEAKANVYPPIVTPVIKVLKDETGKSKRFIQSIFNDVQVGGDDRLGVAISVFIAVSTGLDLGLYFATDEEIGLKSARMCEFPQLKEFDLVCEIDKGNCEPGIVNKISGEILMDYDTASTLVEIAYNIGSPRPLINGYSTDVYALKSRGMVKNATNLVCGYHNSIGSGGLEYIDVQQAIDTKNFCYAIARHYYLNQK